MVTNIYPSTIQNPSVLTPFTANKGTEAPVISTAWYWDSPSNTSLKFSTPGTVVNEGIKIANQAVTPSTQHTIDMIVNIPQASKNMVLQVFKSDGTTSLGTKTFTSTGMPQLVTISVTSGTDGGFVFKVVTNSTSQAITAVYIDSIWLYTGPQNTYQTVQSGDWGTKSTWDMRVPCDGMAVQINTAHTIRFNVDQSAWVNGLAGLTINGILHFKSSSVTGLKMNGNITTGANGRLYVAYYYLNPKADFIKVNGYNNVYYTDQIYKNYYEKMDSTPLTKVNSIDEVENTPDSFYEVESTLEYYLNITEDYVGYIVPIGRPTAGVESLCQLILNATATINVPIIRMYGWYPNKEFTQLSADAAVNATTIVLNEDLGLQAGDKIVVGCGAVDGSPGGESCLYTVSAYNISTKTITITPGLINKRLKGDYVAFISRPIKVSRTSGTPYIIATKIDNCTFVGVNFATGYLGGVDQNNSLDNWVIKHCSITGRTVLTWGKNVIIEDVVCRTSYVPFNTLFSGSIKRVLCMQGALIAYSSLPIIDCISQNTSPESYNTYHIFKNCIFKNIGAYETFSCGLFYNCIIDGFKSMLNAITQVKMVDCDIVLREDALQGFEGELCNCLFKTRYEVKSMVNQIIRQPNQRLNSINHNRIKGNFKSWCKGGRIETYCERGDL